MLSLSFDPNRDDKFDTLIYDTVKNYQRNAGLESAKTAMEIVLRTATFFETLRGQKIEIHADDYLKQVMGTDRFSRVAGRTIEGLGWSLT